MSEMKILNIHKIYQHLQSSNFMFKKNKKQFHLYFQIHFTEVLYLCPTRFSENSFVENKIVLS